MMTLTEWQAQIANWGKKYGGKSLLDFTAKKEGIYVVVHTPNGDTLEEFTDKVFQLLENTDVDICSASRSLIDLSYGKKTPEETAEQVNALEDFLFKPKIAKIAVAETPSLKDLEAYVSSALETKLSQESREYIRRYRVDQPRLTASSLLYLKTAVKDIEDRKKTSAEKKSPKNKFVSSALEVHIASDLGLDVLHPESIEFIRKYAAIKFYPNLLASVKRIEDRYLDGIRRIEDSYKKGLAQASEKKSPKKKISLVPTGPLERAIASAIGKFPLLPESLEYIRKHAGTKSYPHIVASVRAIESSADLATQDA
jgi:hypothetical protein